MNVGRLALDNIEKFGEFTSLHFEGQAYTNTERNRFAGALAQVLQSYGVKPGDFVMVMMANSPDVTAAFQACWKIGAAIIPVTPMLNVREVGYMLEHSEARVVVTSPVLASRVREAAEAAPKCEHVLVLGESETEGAEDITPKIAEASPIETLEDRANDDLAMLLYTSGTTGHPKGVMLTHENLHHNHTTVAALSHTMAPKTHSLLVLPLSHSFGVLMMNIGYVLGIESTLLTHFDTEKVLKTISEFGVERFSVVPTMLSYMVNHPERESYDYSTLTQVNTGGSALMNDVREEFERLFGCKVKEGYGLSETSPTLTSYGDSIEYRPGSVGKAIPDVEVRIVDFENNVLAPGRQGEICARGPNIMKGYWKNEEETREVMVDGWLHSGDIGYIDEEGFVYITDRKKELIIKGGENISPREIEEGLQAHPAVAEAAVLAVPDPVFGENIAAAVVLKPDHEATEEELREHLGKYVTKFKIPATFHFLPILPKNPTGKIQKREIKKQILPAVESAQAK